VGDGEEAESEFHVRRRFRLEAAAGAEEAIVAVDGDVAVWLPLSGCSR